MKLKQKLAALAKAVNTMFDADYYHVMEGRAYANLMRTMSRLKLLRRRECPKGLPDCLHRERTCWCSDCWGAGCKRCRGRGIVIEKA